MCLFDHQFNFVPLVSLSKSVAEISFAPRVILLVLSEPFGEMEDREVKLGIITSQSTALTVAPVLSHLCTCYM